MSKSIALVGNPNCGKTTLFNRLTGANQRIGNWPGVTVEQHHGQYLDEFTRETINVIDLPGCYSLVVTEDMALDEKIACEYIAVSRNTVYLNVVDASHLSRDLYLTLQLLELGLPVVVVLNCLDLAQEAGIQIDEQKLASQLGCPVVSIIAKNGTGIDRLQRVLRQEIKPTTYKVTCPQQLHDFLCKSSVWNEYFGNDKLGETFHLLEGDELIEQKYSALGVDVAAIRAQTSTVLSVDLDIYIAQYRRQLLQQVLDDAVSMLAKRRLSISDRVDNIVLHKVFGPLIFLGVMYLMFTCAINLGGMLQLGFERVSESIFIGGMQTLLFKLGLQPWLINILAEGLGRGVSITLTFTPVLGAMFLCLGVLESSGYMTRAAFIVDRLMSHLGLSGKSFVPMIVGFGCNVPAVMGARTLSSQRERILTIMMTPFMSCSARLAIYAIFVAAFFPVGGQNVIFSLYLIGILVAVFTGLALRGSVKANAHVTTMSLMEMPDYRWPLWSALFRQVWHRLKGFLLKAGIYIVALCVIINGLGNDVLAELGKALTVVFAPIGISPENWPATVGLMTGMIAKEAVVGTLNAFYVSEAAMVQSFGGVIQAYAYLLFTLLYFPCVSVVAAISKELNFKWALFSVFWSTGLAYLIAALFYQVATLNSWSWIIGLSAVLVGFFAGARRLVRQQQHGIARKVVPTAISLT